MRKLFTIITTVLLTVSTFAAAPQKMSYQAVVRNSSNVLVVNTNIGMQISIIQGSATGTSVYVERQIPKTNSNGLVTIEIGSGVVISGNLSTIDWSTGTYFVKTETDLNGGTSYTITGTSQLLSVPYAMYAQKAGNVDNVLEIIQSLQNGVTDVDGNHYKTVIIGKQVWMVENLKTTHYQDGTTIPNVTDGVTWMGLQSGAYCDYSNNTTNGTIYGHLYNYFSILDSHNLAPKGWHIPSDAEWMELSNYLGGLSVAGGKMKETGTAHWATPNTNATNLSGFTAIGGSWRGDDGNYYYSLSNRACYWSSTLSGTDYPWYYTLVFNTGEVLRTAGAYFKKGAGVSIRCVKD